MADKLSVKELSEFLSEKGLDNDVIQLLRDEKVDGKIFLELDNDELKELGVKFGDRKKLLKVVRDCLQSQKHSFEPSSDDLQTDSQSQKESSVEVIDPRSTLDKSDISQRQAITGDITVC